jgi:hypothetical protein
LGLLGAPSASASASARVFSASGAGSAETSGATATANSAGATDSAARNAAGKPERAESTGGAAGYRSWWLWCNGCSSQVAGADASADATASAHSSGATGAAALSVAAALSPLSAGTRPLAWNANVTGRSSAAHASTRATDPALARYPDWDLLAQPNWAC